MSGTKYSSIKTRVVGDSGASSRPPFVGVIFTEYDMQSSPINGDLYQFTPNEARVFASVLLRAAEDADGEMTRKAVGDE